MATSLGFPEPADTSLLADCAKRDRELAAAINAYLITAGRTQSGVQDAGVLVANTAKSIPIVFDTEFADIPRIVVSANTTAPHQRLASIANVSSTGFNIVVINTASTATFSVHWHAHY